MLDLVVIPFLFQISMHLGDIIMVVLICMHGISLLFRCGDVSREETDCVGYITGLTAHLFCSD